MLLLMHCDRHGTAVTRLFGQLEDNARQGSVTQHLTTISFPSTMGSYLSRLLRKRRKPQNAKTPVSDWPGFQSPAPTTNVTDSQEAPPFSLEGTLAPPPQAIYEPSDPVSSDLLEVEIPATDSYPLQFDYDEALSQGSESPEPFDGRVNDSENRPGRVKTVSNITPVDRPCPSYA